MSASKWSILGASAVFGLAIVQPVSAALVAYFPFENSLSSGGTVSLGAPTVTGTPVYAAGDTGFGQSLDMPGGSGLFIEYPSGGTAIDLDNTSYTISAKVFMKEVSASARMRLFSTDNSLAANNHAWGLRAQNGNNAPLYMHHNNEIGGGALNANQWANVVMRYDAGTGTRHLIVNNVIMNKETGIPAGEINSDLNFRIGNYVAEGAQGAFAKLDDIRIYNEALSVTFENDVLSGEVIGGDVFHLFDAPVVPEPTSMATIGAGIVAMLSRRFRKSS
jgi:hypothetical protein